MRFLGTTVAGLGMAAVLAITPAPLTAQRTGAFQQDMSEAARNTTEQIRQGIMDDQSLSFVSKNVNVVTQAQQIVLSGQVRTQQEKDSIQRIAEQHANGRQVVNRINVTGNQGARSGSAETSDRDRQRVGTAGTPDELPRTASPVPLVALGGVLALGLGLALPRRRS